MKRVLDRFGGVITALCELGVGIFLFIDHDRFSETIITVLGVVIAAMGIFEILGYFRMTPEEGTESMGMTKGLLGVLAGFFCVFRAEWFTNTFPVMTVVYGVAMVVLGVRKLAETVDMLRLKNSSWTWKLAGGLVTAICAVVTLKRPLDGDAMWIFIGVALVVEGVIDIITLVMSAVLRKKKSSSDEEIVES